MLTGFGEKGQQDAAVEQRIEPAALGAENFDQVARSWRVESGWRWDLHPVPVGPSARSFRCVEDYCPNSHQDPKVA